VRRCDAVLGGSPPTCYGRNVDVWHGYTEPDQHDPMCCQRYSRLHHPAHSLAGCRWYGYESTTEDEIKQLREDAREAGNSALALRCSYALEGDSAALAELSKIIEQAREAKS
jgi:hypothetical protein